MDVIVYFGHHKCASTYICAVLRNVARAIGHRLHTEFLSTRLPLGYEREPAQARRIQNALHYLETGRYNFLCHGNADDAVVTAVSNHGPFRGFHLIRDPRDIIVSGYFWHTSQNSIDPNPANQWTRERMERLLSASSKEAGLLMELQFSECYMAALGEWNYHQDNVLELRYEDMILDPQAFFIRVFAFVGLPVVTPGCLAHLGIFLNRITHRTLRRQAVRLNVLPQPVLNQILADHSFTKHASKGESGRGQKYRKGVAGDWRNHFTPRLRSAFKERYGNLLLQLGYEEDLNW